MKDIQTRADIELLMREFYNSLLADNSISYIFMDVASINLEEHLPHLADFWEQNILQTGSYKKNVMRIHLDLNNNEPLTPQHFETWLSHFYKTIDNLFTGFNAELIKTRALSIATIMKIKTLHNQQS